MSFARRLFTLVFVVFACAPSSVIAYPLDGYPETGIRRLEAA